MVQVEMNRAIFRNMADSIKLGENGEGDYGNLFDQEGSEAIFEEVEEESSVPEFSTEEETILLDINERFTDNSDEGFFAFTVTEPGYVLTETVSYGKGLGRLVTDIYSNINEDPIDGDSATDDDDFSEGIKYEPGKYFVKVRPYSASDLGIYTLKIKWCKSRCRKSSSKATTKKNILMTETGIINQNDLKEWYDFTVPAAGHVLIKTTQSSQDKKAYVRTEIYESRDDDFAYDEIEDPESNEYSTDEQEYSPGKYYLKIFSDLDDIDENINYEVSVKYCKSKCTKY